jgi:ADP-ribosylglycohydrolase
MASKHIRNTSGMHDARRCTASTRNGSPCGSPAVTGKERCHVHQDKGIKARAQAKRLGDHSRAVIERDRQTMSAIRKLDKVIRAIDQGAGQRSVLELLQDSRQELMRTTQQTQDQFAQAFKSPPSVGFRKLHTLADLSQDPHYDRALGAMLGLAVGEAVGVAAAGQPRDSFVLITDMDGGGMLNLQPGQWTAGTAMALALTEVFACRNRLSEIDFMQRLLAWHEKGVNSCTGTSVGISPIVVEALSLFKQTNDPIAGNTHPDGLDSGGMIRAAPLAIAYRNRRKELFDVAARQSRTTDGGAYAVDASIAFADILAGTICGDARETILGPRHLPEAPHAARVLDGSWRNKAREEIYSRNNAYYILEAALWCMSQEFCFEDAVLLAANLGDDATLTAGLVGQLAGAHYGARAIRKDWLKKLAWHDHIVNRTDSLFAVTAEPIRRELGTTAIII